MSDHKQRGKRLSKVKFHGNRHSKLAKKDVNEAIDSVTERVELEDGMEAQECSTKVNTESCTGTETTPPCRSEMKLFDMYTVSKKALAAVSIDSDTDPDESRPKLKAFPTWRVDTSFFL